MMHSNIQGYKQTETPFEKIQLHVFKKEEGIWYIHLPQYIEQGWSKKDLEMAEGADKLLNTIASGRHRVTLLLSTEPFAGADRLELIEHCKAPKGGAIYLLDTCHGKKIGSQIWVCDIALFVFGDMPENIYFQQVSRPYRNQKANGNNTFVQ